MEKIHTLDAPRLQNAPYNLGLTPDFYRTFGNPSQSSPVYLILLPHYFQSEYNTTNGMDTSGARSWEHKQKDKPPARIPQPRATFVTVFK